MFRFTLAVMAAVILVSCASKQPKVEPKAEPAPVVRDTVHSVRTDTLRVIDSIIVKETSKTLQKSIDSLLTKGEEEKAIELLKVLVQQYNPAYMGPRTVQLANLLHKTGHSAEALAVLEGFAVYKPVINSWIDSANALYDKILATNKAKDSEQIDQAKLEIINSLTSQITNYKRMKAAPALIVDLADSLRSIAPGDSVLIWLDKQVPTQLTVKTENSDSFCEEQRKIATEKFAASRKNKAKARVLLTEAIEVLDKCLVKTLSPEMRKKVVQNREILMQELKEN